MSERRDNSGALFKNDRKEQDTHADYRGSITINGVEYWLDAWIKEGAKGKFIGLKAKPKKLPADHNKGHSDRNADDGLWR